MAYLFNGKNAKHSFDRTCAAEKVTNSTLGAADVHIGRSFFAFWTQEERFDSCILGRVANNGRGRVGVDVVNGSWWQRRLFQGLFHCHESTFAIILW